MKNKKAALTSGVSNQLNADGIFNQIPDYIATKSIKNQRICLCGAIIPRDEILLEKAKACSDCRQKEAALAEEIISIVETPRKIVRCTRCVSCKRPFALAKLSSLLICKGCLESTRVENPSKQKRIIAGLIENYAASLRRQIFAGGAR